MYDMLGYLEHRFAAPDEARLTIAATRHEDGTFSASSLGFHEQRGRLLHSLASIDGVSGVEFSDSVDAEYPCETGHAWIDIPVGLAGFAGSVATVVSAWVSIRPRKKSDSVPGIRIDLPGSSLIVTGEVGRKERKRLIEAFLDSQVRRPKP
jgi:hypothetical protein